MIEMIMITKKLRKTKVTSALFLISVFIFSWIYFANPPGGSAANIKVLLTPILLLVWVSIVLYNPPKLRFTINDCIIIASVIIYFVYSIVWSYSLVNSGAFSFLFCILLAMQRDDVKGFIFKWFKIILVISSIHCIICYALYILGIRLPHSVIGRASFLDMHNTYLCFSPISILLQNGPVLRLCGFFEEPGHFGTIAAFYLCADEINLKKKSNLVIFIAGLFSLSLGFILLLVIYFILKSIKNYKMWIFLILFAFFFLFVLPNLKTGNPVIDAVLSRLVIKDGKLAGDNRTKEGFDQLFMNTLKSSRVFLGYGNGYSRVFTMEKGEDIASFKSFIVDFGIIGTFILFFPLFCAAIAKSKRNSISILFVLINYISLYQRPTIFAYSYFAVFVCGLSYLNKKELFENNQIRARKYRNFFLGKYVFKPVYITGRVTKYVKQI